MSKPNQTPQDPPDLTPTFEQADMAKARNWFAKGQELAEKKNYDYAIECYVSGLDFWPEAVEEGHKPCRAAALFRGPKKVGFTDQYKYKTNLKDPKRSMLNAEMLLSKDPRNLGYLEALFTNAAKAHYYQTVMWIGEVLAEAATREEKQVPARYELLRRIYEELAARMGEADTDLAIKALQRAVDALSRLAALKPQDMAVSTDLRDVAGKLTIIKGKYSSADSFRDSMSDSERQHELHDKERAVQSDERMEDLIARAERQYHEDPSSGPAISNLVDLLCRRENQADETKAIGILVKAYKEADEYRHKLRADDIRIKQLTRKARQIAASGDQAAARQHFKEQLRFELGVFKERCRLYPTDLRLRFQYGRRLFQAGRYDDAIPMLQEARNDPKTRTQCNLYIARCFYEKGYYGQATDILKEAIRGHEIADDDLGKEMHYWLGRTQQAGGEKAEALKAYGQLIQWDYNYRDVRKRIEELKNPAPDVAGPQTV